jgi:flavin-dependent dehydrogenase
MNLQKKGTITIAGAGPSGLTAAIILARAGYKVRVFERNSSVGVRFNDDYQGLENWSRKEDVLDEIQNMGIEPTWWQRPFSGGILYNPDLRPTEINAQRPLFYLVRRGNHHPASLDLALFKQAQELGVEFRFKKSADIREIDIMAGGPRGKPCALAAGMTFTTDRDDYICSILSEQLAPGGYVYLLIADGQATLATVLFSKFKQVEEYLDKSINAIKQLLNINEFPNAKYWGGYGGFSIPQTGEKDGVLYIGEAGGFQDFLFGFGIRNAIVSAGLAAQSIIHNTSYDELWQNRLLSHLKASFADRIIFESFDRIVKQGFWLIVGNHKYPESFMRWLYSNSIIHKAIYSLSYKKHAHRLTKILGE